jgi:hypothetical protein
MQSWIIRKVKTGEAVLEVWCEAKPNVVTQYEAVPVLQHLHDLNNPGTKAYAWARYQRQSSQE